MLRAETLTHSPQPPLHPHAPNKEKEACIGRETLGYGLHFAAWKPAEAVEENIKGGVVLMGLTPQTYNLKIKKGIW